MDTLAEYSEPTILQQVETNPTLPPLVDEETLRVGIPTACAMGDMGCRDYANAGLNGTASGGSGRGGSAGHHSGHSHVVDTQRRPGRGAACTLSS